MSVSGLGQSFTGTVPLPAEHLENIGTAENGVSAAELSKQILKPILVNATKVASEALTGLTKDLKGLGTNQVGNAAKGFLNNLIKK